MSQVFSKVVVPLTGTIKTSCVEYVHPWTDSCLQGITGLYLYAIFDSMRVYATVYTLTLLMKGRIPNKEDLQRTLLGIVQSTAFLSGTGFGYSLFLCLLRKILGNFNILTVSALPAFFSSVFSILIERPSRRTLLCLYVSNVATETVWNMLLSRGMVRNVRYGNTLIFSASMALLLMYYKGGTGQTNEEGSTSDEDSDGGGGGSSGGTKADSMFGVIRFVVGPYEEKDYSSARSSQASTFYRQQQQQQQLVQNIPNEGAGAAATATHPSRRSGGGTGNINNNSWRNAGSPRSRNNAIFHLVTQALRVYKKLIYRIKCCDRHHACPHPFSCLYYTMHGVGKMFSIGLGIQVTIKLVLNIKKILDSPKNLKEVLFRPDTLNLASFLGGFSGLFRAVLCVLRRATGKDRPSYAIPAGLIAGVTFTRYPDTTVSLYVLWKAAQITYNIGIDKGYVPRVPGFTEFLYCFSTAILFHAALLEPTNLRPSYWKFLHSISGGRIACMNREPLDAWGLGTTESLQKVLQLTKTQQILK